MALGGRDLIATVLAAGSGWIAYVQGKGLDTAVLSSPRWAAVLLLIIGIGMCISGTDATLTQTSPWYKTLAALGGICALLALAGVITGNKTVVEVAAIALVIMWALTTGRHAAVRQ